MADAAGGDDGDPNRQRELLAAWEGRCRSSGIDPTPCSGSEAAFLVVALSKALSFGQHTPELGRAARSWGARLSSPVEALASLAVLRDVLLEPQGQEADADTTRQSFPGAETSHLLDQVMLEAVDSASSNLRAQVRTDPLTGCANRFALNEDLAHAIQSAARSGLDLAVAAVDLDGLKRINDTMGHGAGDEALKLLVRRLRSGLRDADTIYRIGGDEFVVIAPFTDSAGASAMLERVSEGGGPKFSWGVASMSAIGQAALDDPEVLLASADSDLYLRRRTSRMGRRPSSPTDVKAALLGASVQSQSAEGQAAASHRPRRSLRPIVLAAGREVSAAKALGVRTLTAAKSHKAAAASVAASIPLLLAAVLGVTLLSGRGETGALHAPHRSGSGAPSTSHRGPSARTRVPSGPGSQSATPTSVPTSTPASTPTSTQTSTPSAAVTPPSQGPTSTAVAAPSETATPSLTVSVTPATPAASSSPSAAPATGPSPAPGPTAPASAPTPAGPAAGSIGAQGAPSLTPLVTRDRAPVTHQPPPAQPPAGPQTAQGIVRPAGEAGFVGRAPQPGPSVSPARSRLSFLARPGEGPAAGGVGWGGSGRGR